MKTANEELLDAMIRHQIFLLRYSGSVRNKINALLAQSEKDITDKIIVKLARVKPGVTTPVEVERMRALQAVVTEIRKEAWGEVEAFFTDEMKALAYQEPITTNAIVQTVSPVSISTVLPSANMMRAMVLDKPFEGRTMSEWARTLAADDIRRITNAIQMGMVAGESMDKIAARVSGSAELFGSDGVTELTRHQIQSVTRTAVQHIANNARNAYFLENKDIVKLEQFVATLDSRTTPQCKAYDGKRYQLGKGPIPPLHYGCRSLRVAVLSDQFLGNRPANPTTERMLVKEYAQENGLGDIKTRDDLPRGTKGNYDAWARKKIRELVGPVPTQPNSYQTWLEKQSNAFQAETLGVTKAKLFRDGKLPLAKFINRNGDELTLKELAKKHADAFRAAGLNPAEFI